MSITTVFRSTETEQILLGSKVCNPSFITVETDLKQNKTLDWTTGKHERFLVSITLTRYLKVLFEKSFSCFLTFFFLTTLCFSLHSCTFPRESCLANYFICFVFLFFFLSWIFFFLYTQQDRAEKWKLRGWIVLRPREEVRTGRTEERRWFY